MYLKVLIESTNLEKYCNHSGMLISLPIAILYFLARYVFRRTKKPRDFTRIRQKSCGDGCAAVSQTV